MDHTKFNLFFYFSFFLLVATFYSCQPRSIDHDSSLNYQSSRFFGVRSYAVKNLPRLMKSGESLKITFEPKPKEQNVKIFLINQDQKSHQEISTLPSNLDEYEFALPQKDCNQCSLKLVWYPSTQFIESNFFEITSKKPDSPKTELLSRKESNSSKVLVLFPECKPHEQVLITSTPEVPHAFSPGWHLCDEKNKLATATFEQNGIYKIYGFLQNEARVVSSPSDPIEVQLDLVSPVIKVKSAKKSSQGWSVEWEATDSHFSDKPIRIEGKAESLFSGWKDISGALPNTGKVVLHSDYFKEIPEIRVVASDRFGNETQSAVFKHR